MKVAAIVVALLATSWLPEVTSQIPNKPYFLGRQTHRIGNRIRRQTNADQMVQNILQWLQGVYTQSSRKIRQGTIREYLPPSNTQKPRPFEPAIPTGRPEDNTIGYPSAPPGVFPPQTEDHTTGYETKPSQPSFTIATSQTDVPDVHQPDYTSPQLTPTGFTPQEPPQQPEYPQSTPQQPEYPQPTPQQPEYPQQPELPQPTPQQPEYPQQPEQPEPTPQQPEYPQPTPQQPEGYPQTNEEPGYPSEKPQEPLPFPTKKPEEPEETQPPGPGYPELPGVPHTPETTEQEEGYPPAGETPKPPFELPGYPEQPVKPEEEQPVEPTQPEEPGYPGATPQEPEGTGYPPVGPHPTPGFPGYTENGPVETVTPQEPVVNPEEPEVPQKPEVPEEPEYQPGVPQEPEQQPEVPEQPEQQPEVPQQPDQQPIVPEQPEHKPELPQQPEYQPEVPQQPEVPEQPEVPQQPEQQPEVPEQPEQQPEIPEKPEEQPEAPRQPEQLPGIPEQQTEIPGEPEHQPGIIPEGPGDQTPSEGETYTSGPVVPTTRRPGFIPGDIITSAPPLDHSGGGGEVEIPKEPIQPETPKEEEPQTGGTPSAPITPYEPTEEDLKHPPHIHQLDVICDTDKMTITVEFNRPFDGIIYSKGHYTDTSCRYVNENSGQTKFEFTVHLNQCGTELVNTGTGDDKSYLENVLVMQNEAGIQEIWDTVRAVRCQWEQSLKKSLTASLSVGMLNQEIVTFSGDSIMARLDIQKGEGPHAPTATGLVPIGEKMTLVVSVTGASDYDIQVKDCKAKDSASQNEVSLTDGNGCVIKPKLFGAFQKSREEKSVLAYAFFNAFKFPDIMDLMIECNVELCKGDCDICEEPNQKLEPGRRKRETNGTLSEPITVGKLLRVLLPEDLSDGETIIKVEKQGVCMSLQTFVISTGLIIALLAISTILSAYSYLKATQRNHKL